MPSRITASVVIWTTTPWTIPQNRAVCFGPDIAYGLYEVSELLDGSKEELGAKVILAEALAESAFCAAKVKAVLRRTVSADELAALTLAHPFRGLAENGEWDFDVPMLPGDHVTDDAGTGFVHTAPSHGDDDYQIGLKFGLPMTYNVEPDGSYRTDLPLFGGQAILTPEGKEGPANVSVIKALAGAGKLFAKGKLKHSYPHSWRSKAPLIYRNTPQWFAAIDKPLADGMGAAWRHDPQTRARIHRQAGAMDPADGPQPPVQHDRSASRLGAVAPARVGRAADLFHQARRETDRPRLPAARCDRQRPHQSRV
jgi:isoleucyl-tRNA synthetase